MDFLMSMVGMNGIKINNMGTTFDFREALQWIDFGEMVGIELNNKIRFYYKKGDTIMCKINNTIYPVKQFYIDAIQSNNWWLCE